MKTLGKSGYESNQINQEEFGHPDGKQAMQLGIALPSWLVEKQNSFLVLGVYALIFGIALPMWVATGGEVRRTSLKTRLCTIPWAVSTKK